MHESWRNKATLWLCQIRRLARQPPVFFSAAGSERQLRTFIIFNPVRSFTSDGSMFSESDYPVLSHFPDKRPASPSFENGVRCDKKSRIQAVEPDFDHHFLDVSESYHLPNFALSFDDVFCDETRMAPDEDNGTEMIFSQAESPESDTLPDTCFGVVSYPTASSNSQVPD